MEWFGQVWYEAGLPVGYQPRRTYRALLQQYRRFGRWKAFYWRSTGDRPRPRQVVILALPAAGLVGSTTLALAVPTLIAPAALAGVGTLLMIDHIGAEAPASAAERLGSCVAMAIIGLGWWSGATQEMLKAGNNHGR